MLQQKQVDSVMDPQVAKIANRIYGKVIFAAIAATALAVAAFFSMDLPIGTTLMMWALVLFYFGSTAVSLFLAIRRGEVALVYGCCASTEDATNLVGKVMKERYSYRFTALSEKAKVDADEDSHPVASFFIKGERGKFVVGESYAMLFYVQGNEVRAFNENNLVGFSLYGDAPLTVSATSSPDSPLTANPTLSEAETALDMTPSGEAVAANVVLFPGTKEE